MSVLARTQSASRLTTSRAVKAAAAAAMLLTLAACGGGSSGSTADSTPASAGGGIGSDSTSLGTILTDGAGKTMYAFAADVKGKSNCTGSCLTYWPPVLVKQAPKAPSGVTAALGVIPASNGTKQLTVDGWPMYTYVGDGASGQTRGQGLNESGGLWWVVGTNGSWIKNSPAAGMGGY
jgi:predicted lipoprotein with Yx(FWY)xxD motif